MPISCTPTINTENAQNSPTERSSWYCALPCDLLHAQVYSGRHIKALMCHRLLTADPNPRQSNGRPHTSSRCSLYQQRMPVILLISQPRGHQLSVDRRASWHATSDMLSSMAWPHQPRGIRNSELRLDRILVGDWKAR